MIKTGDKVRLKENYFGDTLDFIHPTVRDIGVVRVITIDMVEVLYKKSNTNCAGYYIWFAWRIVKVYSPGDQLLLFE